MIPATTSYIDDKSADIAQFSEYDRNDDGSKEKIVDLVAAQQVTLQEAKSIRQTLKEDRKVFAVVGAALVSVVY